MERTASYDHKLRQWGEMFTYHHSILTPRMMDGKTDPAATSLSSVIAVSICSVAC